MSGIKQVCWIGIAVLLLAGGFACGTSVHRSTAEEWLNSLEGGSPHKVGGAWMGPRTQGFSPWSGYYDATFGPLVLIQEGGKLKGSYHEYEVMGRITGQKVFLVGVHSDVVYHTWHFTYSPEAAVLTGRMCDGYFPQEEPHCYPLTLTRSSN